MVPSISTSPDKHTVEPLVQLYSLGSRSPCPYLGNCGDIHPEESAGVRRCWRASQALWRSTLGPTHRLLMSPWCRRTSWRVSALSRSSWRLCLLVTALIPLLSRAKSLNCFRDEFVFGVSTMMFFFPLEYALHTCVFYQHLCQCFGHLVGRGVEGQRSSTTHSSVF